MRKCATHSGESEGSGCSGGGALRELQEAVLAGLDGELLELTREVQADGGLDLSGAESLPLRVDHEGPGLAHDLLEELNNNVVDERHALLGDAELRLDLLEDSEDVGLEGVGVAQLQLLFAGGLASGPPH